MSTFLQLTAAGLSMGMVYAMLSLGLILLLRAVGVMNFAQGSFLVLGAYTFYFVYNRLNITGIPGLIIMALFFMAFGVVFMFTCYWPVRNTKWRQALMITTMGASNVITEICLLVCGSRKQSMKPIIPGALKIGSFILQYQYIIIFVVALVIMILVYVLFEKLYVGRAMSAASQNKYAAELIGIPTMLTVMATFMVVMLCAGFAGYLVAPIFFVRTSLTSLQTRAFAGIVLGGFGNLDGAIIGSLIIGLVESYSTYITTTYKDVVVYGLLLLVLVFRPQGLFSFFFHSNKA